MRQMILIPLLIPLLAGGCFTGQVRSLGTSSTATHARARGAILWKNGNVGVQSIQYETKTLRERSVGMAKRETSVVGTQFYLATAADITSRMKGTSGNIVTFDYSPYPIEKDSPVALEIDEVLSSSEGGYTNRSGHIDTVYSFAEGRSASFLPLKLSFGEDDPEVNLVNLSRHYSKRNHERTVTGKALQILLVPAVALDIVTSPIQFVGAVCVVLKISHEMSCGP
jgi:hypothetical protein